MRSAVAPNADATTTSPTSAAAKATANLPSLMRSSSPPHRPSTKPQYARECREIRNREPPSRPGTRGREAPRDVGGPPGRGRVGAAGRVVVPPRRPRGRHLQDRGRRQPRPAAGRAGRARLLPARRQLHHHRGAARRVAFRDGPRGEAVLADGLGTRVQRPRGWANQKVLYDAKRHAHTAQGLALSTIHRPAYPGAAG